MLSSADEKNVQGTTILAPHDTGFTFDRTAFGGGATDPVTAFPNQLQWVTVRNGKGYLSNVAAFPQGPVKFDSDTQGFGSIFDTALKAELSGGTINLILAVAASTALPKLFLANPWTLRLRAQRKLRVRRLGGVERGSQACVPAVLAQRSAACWKTRRIATQAVRPALSTIPTTGRRPFSS
jgi:hypothetical protein